MDIGEREIKMVGALRKYQKTAMMAATGIVGDSPLFVIDYLLRFMRVALLLAIWRTLFQHRHIVAGLPLEAVLTYTLIGEVFAEPLAGYTGLGEAFWDGSIATRFLRPMNLFGQFAAEVGGQWVFNLVIFSLPLLLFAPWLGASPMPASLGAGLLFLCSLALAITVGLALDFISGAVTVGLEMPPGVMDRMRRAVGGLLSGAILPLALMPWGLGKALAWTPFAALASAPLQIYIGRGDAVQLLALQACWAVVLWPLASWLWTKQRERMVSYGG